MIGGSAFDSQGRYDEAAAIAHDRERLAINKAEHPDNVIEGLFRAHGAFNGLSPLDESVATAREYQATIGRLERQLALKDEAIALLRDCWNESERELDTLRERMAEAVP